MTALSAFLKTAYGAQLGRFLRLFAAAAVPLLLSWATDHPTLAALTPLFVGAAEVAYRQWKPGVVTHAQIKAIAENAVAKLPQVTGTNPAAVVTKDGGLGALELVAVVFVVLVVLLLLHRI